MLGLLGILFVIVIIGIKEWIQTTNAEVNAEIIRKQKGNRG